MLFGGMSLRTIFSGDFLCAKTYLPALQSSSHLSGSLAVTDDDEMMVISCKGRLIRMPVVGITVMKSHSVGNIIVRLDEGDSVADCSIIRADEPEPEGTLSFGAELEM